MEESREVIYKLGRIEMAVEQFGKKLDEYITDAKVQHDNHEARITTLEKQWVKLLAVASTLGVIGSAAFETIKWILSN